MRNSHGAVAAHCYQGIQTQGIRIGKRKLGGLLGGQRIGSIAGTQYGAAVGQNSTHRTPVKRAGAFFHQACKPVFNAHHLGVAHTDERLGNGANHRIQSWAIAATRQ